MLKNLKNLGKAAALCIFVMYGAFLVPQTHNSYLRYEVGSSVVQVLSPKGGGGTGFAIQADSGARFIMTNKHVCEVGVNGWVIIKQDEGSPVYKRIVYKDNRHDLCLIEGDKRFDSLELGKHPSKGDYMYIVGHPGLRQLTVSSGEYIGYDNVELVDFSVTKREKCQGKVMELHPIQQIMYGIEFACVRSYRSFATTAVAYGGNSGSPVVNKYGNVVGVLFAGDTEQERDNYVVPLSEIKRVLSKF